MTNPVPWLTIRRILLAALAVWVALQLRHIFMVFLVATILAIALNPIVDWLDARRVPRGWAASLLAVTLLLAVGTFFFLSWSNLMDQSHLIAVKSKAGYAYLVEQFPGVMGVLPWGRKADPSTTASLSMRIIGGITGSLLVIVLGFILMVYLLADGRRTYRWLCAYVPRAHRDRVDATCTEVERVVSGYVAGNFATSGLTTIVTYVGLRAMNVPAALLLALLAGICDLVPIVGFLTSLIPAVFFALMVSQGTAVAVIAFYVGYNMIENYVIAPRVYGNRLRLSPIAVLVAFAVGSELAGVVGALIALPIAAAYPTIERVWLRPYLVEGAVTDHKRIENEVIAAK